jgi:diguanylate cyclase (GGDEF)-like protein
VEAELAEFDAECGMLGVFMFDVNGFRTINDSMGHDVGDRVLLAIARRLSALAGPQDLAGHFVADKFLFLRRGIADETTAIEVAKDLNRAIATPLNITERELFLTGTVGIALSADGSATPGTLLRDADTALFKAKERGSSHAVFESELHDRAVEKLKITSDLGMALEREEFRVFYQPQVRLNTGETVGVEALLRWDHPERGLLMPSDFIAEAERMDQIIPIGLWVLEQTCLRLKTWREADGLRLIGSVNVAPRQLAQPDFVKQVDEILRRTEIDPAQVCLEVTESTVVRDPAIAIAMLGELKKLGLHLAMDDFGTGYSSLSALNQFPIDSLKIDRSFVSQLGEGSRGKRVVAAILGIADALELNVIAEGVEEAEHITQLEMLGCTFAQGYLFGHPEPEPKITKSGS